MAALSKQRGVELMRWARGTMHNRVVRAYFMGGRVLEKQAGGGFKVAGTWRVIDLQEVKADLAANGWTQVASLGKKIA